MKGKVAKLKLFVFLLGALMFGISLVVAPQSTAGATAAQQQQKQEEEQLEYSCPMHPDFKTKTPGKCPKCGMTLKQVSHSHAPAPAVTKAGARYGANYFTNAPLITQDGQTVHFYDDLLKGKIVAIDLIYTRCKDNCPLETARIVQVQKLLGDRVGKDIFFYSISIDPKQDTPKVLKAYAEKFHAGPGWLFLTGKWEDIELIGRRLGLYDDPAPNDRDGHTPTLLIGDPATGQWMRNSALDNPRFLVLQMTQMMDGWKRRNAAEVAKSYADAPDLKFTNGQYLFSTRCAACHTVGKGDSVGPDLFGVASSRDRKWLTRMIAVPDQMLAEKDPLATALFQKYKEVQMPNMRLPEDDVASLIEYIQTQTAARMKEKAGEGTK